MIRSAVIAAFLTTFAVGAFAADAAPAADAPKDAPKKEEKKMKHHHHKKAEKKAEEKKVEEKAAK